jgi:sugar-phosphatase
MLTFRAAAVLFDLDGVLVDSMSAIRTTWVEWGARHGVPSEQIIAALSMTGVELVQRFAPELDPVTEAQSIALTQAHGEGEIRPFDGAAELVRSVPHGRWAVVTSGLRVLATGHLASAGLPQPRVLITAEDTRRGKPDPAGYLLAAERLGIDPAACLVIEDAPLGIAAARAAGMHVVAVASTRASDELSQADAVVDRLRDIAIVAVASNLKVSVRQSGESSA